MHKLCIGLLIVAVFLGAQHAHLRGAAAEQAVGPPEIAGTNAIVIDASDGSILVELNSTQRRAPASLTKIFTAYFAIESTPMQRRMTVSKADLVGEASAGLNAGDNLSFETLLHGLMLASGNDAAMTIARGVGESYAPSALDGVASFTEHVNNRLAALGLTDTHLVNPHGLDAAGHYSSARDIAAITMLALRTEPDFLRVVSSPGYVGEDMHFIQRNQIIGNYPGGLGGKTGITDDAGFCLMTIAHHDGRTLISVVLGSTSEHWYSDSMALLDAGFATPRMDGGPAISLSTASQSASVHPAAASVQGFAVRMASDAISVQPAIASSGSSWNVLRWPIGTFLAMIVALVVIVQMRALAELQKRPRARGMRPRQARRLIQRQVWNTPSPEETQPFPTVRSWERSATSWIASAGD